MKFPEQYRCNKTPGMQSSKGSPFGMFRVPEHGKARTMCIIACDGEETGWEHVSVSLPFDSRKCPSWDEMCIVKDLFWDESECVVQFHPPKSEHVNNHSGCLHLWRFTGEFPQPPSILVGIKGITL